MEKWNRALMHGTSALAVLAILAKGPLHPYAIRQALIDRTRSRLVPSESRIYPLLDMLEKRGWVASRMMPGRGEQLRRVCQITPAGRTELRHCTEAWTAFAAGVDRLLR